MAMKLQHIQRHSPHDRVQFGVIRIHHKRHLGQTNRGFQSQSARRFNVHIAWRFLKKDKPRILCARSGHSRNILWTRQPANFHPDVH